MLNLLTYVFFRILLLGWMTRWLTLHRDDIPLLFFTVGSLGLASIVVINIVNLYRLLMSDFIRPDKEKVECHLTNESLDQAFKAAKATEGATVSKDVNRFVSSLFNPDEDSDRDGAGCDNDNKANGHALSSKKIN